MDASNYLENAVINTHLRTGTPQIALYSVIPTPAGTGGTEVVGGSYARQDVTFVAPTAGITSNSTAITFSAMPTVVVRAAAIWLGANLIALKTLSQPRTVTANSNYVITAGDIVVRVA